MVVAAASEELVDSMCAATKDEKNKTISTTCDYTQLQAVAVPGTYCLGTRCAADIPFDPALRDQFLLIAYPGPCAWGVGLWVGRGGGCWSRHARRTCKRERPLAQLAQLGKDDCQAPFPPSSSHLPCRQLVQRKRVAPPNG